MPQAKSQGVIGLAKKIYNDAFFWNLAKSWAFFAGGIFVAREVLQFDPTLDVAAAAI